MAFKLKHLAYSRYAFGWQLHLLSLCLFLTLIIAMWQTFPQATSAVILHYSVGIGIDFIGDSNQIQTLGVIGGIFLVTNIALGHIIYSTNRAAAWVVWGINPFVQTFLLIAYLLLWQLNR